jgi:multicomponent Na+:H+ antiporter subunit G
MNAHDLAAHDLATYVVAVLLVAGAAITLIAAIGLLRLPDLLTRMHAASKAGTAGSGLLLLAAAIHAGELDVWLKALASIGFFLLTTPVAAHLLARAYRSRRPKPRDEDGTGNK